MKEQDNVALVQRLYAAFSRGDIQTILDHLTPDVVWRLEGPASLPVAGTRHGPGQVADFFRHFAEFDEHKLTVEDYIAQDDKVATTGRFSYTLRATGKKVDMAVAHVFTIRDGRVAQLYDFVDTAQMLSAYGAASAARG